MSEPLLAVPDALPAQALGQLQGWLEAQPLRETVLAGSYFGAAAGPAASALAEFPFLDPALALETWFGSAWLRRDDRRGSLRGALDRDIAALDALIAGQLDALLHHPRVRRLEGSWRGLYWLVGGIDPALRVRVKLFDVDWPEICRDLERASEFDQSQLFKKIYEEEFGTAGGQPYGLLAIDHELRHRPAPGHPTDDVTALASLASVAAAAFAPTVLGASPGLLEVDGFADLATVAELANPFAGQDHARWRSLSQREDSRFLAVTLPRLLARPAWSDEPGRSLPFRYVEHAPTADERVWMSAVYAFAAIVARAFAANAWPADVRGVEPDRVGAGLIDELPLEPFSTDPPDIVTRPTLEVQLTDRQERALVAAGLMPVGALPFANEAVFGAVRSLQAPQLHRGAAALAADANAKLSTQLNSMLCVSRFAHYVKVMGRDMVGSFKTAEEIERRLQRWLAGYVNTSLTAGGDSRARFPLVDARVTVKERSGQPGVYGCIVHLQPYYQLDEVAATFRLVTEISAAGARQA